MSTFHFVPILLKISTSWKAAFVIVVGGTISLGGLWLMPRVWRGDPEVVRAIHSALDRFVPLGPRLAEALIRGFPTAIAGMASLVAAITIEFAAGAPVFPEPSGPRRVTVTILFALALVLLLTHVVVLLFNRPRLAVPPKMREERGLIGR